VFEHVSILDTRMISLLDSVCFVTIVFNGASFCLSENEEVNLNIFFTET
jgi:hypothetical protein